MLERHNPNALDCFFGLVQHKGALLNAPPLECILKTSSMIGAANKGRQVHNEVVRWVLPQKHIVLDNAFMGLYAKCGSGHIGQVQ